MPAIKQILILRKDLNMRKGKMCAQASHASLKVFLDKATRTEDGKVVITPTEAEAIWLNGTFTKITVSVNSEAELLEIHEKAKAAGIVTALVVDNGLTEFKGVKTPTAVAVGPDYEDKINLITGHLPLL